MDLLPIRGWGRGEQSDATSPFFRPSSMVAYIPYLSLHCIASHPFLYTVYRRSPHPKVSRLSTREGCLHVAMLSQRFHIRPEKKTHAISVTNRLCSQGRTII